MTSPPANSDSAGARLLALEIGGSKLQVCAGNAHGKIFARERRVINPAQGAEGIRAQLSECLKLLTPAHPPAAIGVGYGGPVDWRSGRIVCSHHIPGWEGFPLAAWLQESGGVPVCVENDANVAALGESRFGAGRGAGSMFYVTVGSGVGGGLVSEGRIFHGASPGEAEIGHLRLDAAGRTTESFCSGWSLNRRIRQAVAENSGGDLAARVKADPGHEARHLGPALAAGDALARQILDEAAASLALALSHVTHLFHPEVIVLGGGVALIGDAFRSAVEHHLRPRLMDVFQPGPRLELSALREDAVPAGALALTSDFLSNHHRNPWSSP
jgi:glucokinase